LSGTVTASVVSDVSLGQAANSIKITTSGDSITAVAYSGASLTSAIGTISTTQAGAVKAAKAGIIKVPSNYTQSSTVDNFAAEG
jgi:predicted ABC-type sugar transport system permease subunit